MFKLKLKKSFVKFIKFKNENICGSHYADDSTYYVEDFESVKEIIKIYEKFAKISGLNIEISKSEILPLGPCRLTRIDDNFPLKLVTSVKITGK